MDTSTQNIPESANAPTHKPDTISHRRRMAACGAILTLAGWLTMMLNPWVSLACTGIGLVLSIIGVRIPQSPRRNIAITAIIAAAVLLLVFALFAGVLTLI